MIKKLKTKKLSLLIFAVFVLGTVLALPALALETGVNYGTFTGLGTQDLRVTVMGIIRVILGFLGILAIAIVLYGGFVWMTSAGNAEKISRAKRILVNAVIGLVIIFTSFAITSFIINQLVDATGAGSFSCTPGDCLSCGVECNSSGNGGVTSSSCNGPAFCSVPPTASCPKPNSPFPTICKIEGTQGTGPGGVPLGAAGDYITVEGWYLGDYVDGVSVVNFDTTPADVVSCSALPVWGENPFSHYSVVRVEIPAISNGSYAVTVTNGVTSQVSQSSQYTIVDGVAKPNLACINPTSGANGATLINVEGNDFGATAGTGGLFFNDGQVASYASWSDTEIISPVVPALATSGYVEVVDDAGNDSNDIWFTVPCSDPGINGASAECGTGCCVAFQCSEASACADVSELPVITFVSPNDGAVGNLITIGGQNFGTTAGEVRFWDGSGFNLVAGFGSSANAACSDVWNDDEVIVVIPTGAVDGPIRIVRGDNGFSDTTNNSVGPVLSDFDINSIVRPGICNINPTTGGPGANVVIEGINFVAPVEVNFGAQISLGNPVVASPTTITGARVSILTDAIVGVRVFDVTNAQYSNPINFEVVTTGGPNSFECSKSVFACDPNTDPDDALCQPGFVCDNSCSCVIDPNNPPTGILCDGDISTPVCDPDSTICPTGFSCDTTSCFCKSTSTVAPESSFGWFFQSGITPGSCSIDPGVCSPDDTLCDNNQVCNTTTCNCENVPDPTDIFCDGDISTPVCDPNNIACPQGYTCSTDTCFCVEDTGPGGILCDGDISTPVCDPNNTLCPTGFTCNTSSCLCDSSPANGIESTYTWFFNTTSFGPKIVESCNRTSSCDIGSFSSPSPFNREGSNTAGYKVGLGRQDDGAVPIDSIVVAMFDSKMYVPSLEVDGRIDLQACNSAAFPFDPGSCNDIDASLNITECNYLSFEDPDVTCFKLIPDNLLQQNTWYRVNLDAANIKGINGVELNGNSPFNDDYNWTFKTRDSVELSKVACVYVDPAVATSRSLVDYKNWTGEASPQDFVCVVMNPNSCDWTWDLRNEPVGAERAEINYPDSTIDATPDDWQAVSTPISETTPDNPVEIFATCEVDNNIKEGKGLLNINFTAPVVIDRFPDCGTACLNSLVGATFSLKMNDTSVYNAMELYICYDDSFCENPELVTTFNKTLGADSAETPTTYTGNLDCFDFNNDTINDYCLIPDSYYQVVIAGQGPNAAKSSEGKALAGLNYDDPFNSFDGIDSYRWIFKTQTQFGLCLPDEIKVKPEDKIVPIDTLVKYSARPFTAPDSCNPETGQRLNPYSWDWNWVSTNPAAADLITDAGFLATNGGDLRDACGNGIIERGEDCDDGNILDDACSYPTCLNKGTSAPVCGNGVLDSGEDCDNDSPYCGANCLWIGNTGFICSDTQFECDPTDLASCGGDATKCLAKNVCGNGILEKNELCEPKNSNGCGSNCTLTGSVLGLSICGDGIIGIGEECDLGELVNGGTVDSDDGDGCDASCLIEDRTNSYCRDRLTNKFDFKAGICAGNCGANRDCTRLDSVNGNTQSGPVCANGLIEVGEECDLGGKCSLSGNDCTTNNLSKCQNPAIEVCIPYSGECSADGGGCNNVGSNCATTGFCTSDADGNGICVLGNGSQHDSAACTGAVFGTACSVSQNSVGACEVSVCTNNCQNAGSYYELVDPAFVGPYQLALSFINGVTFIESEIKQYDSSFGGPTGSGRLQVGIGDVPDGSVVVVDKWPDCGTACVNAVIGARFSAAMSTGTINPTSVSIYKCNNSDCSNVAKIEPILISHYTQFESNDSFDIQLPPTYNPIDNDEDDITDGPALLPNTSYRVIIRGTVASAATEFLAGLNFDEDGDLALDSYSWVFTTQPSFDFCTLASVKVNPEKITLPQDVLQKYFFQPRAAPDSCDENGQRLNPWYYDWFALSQTQSVPPINAAQFLTPLRDGCGNGNIEFGEDCDDGNLDNGDGCNSLCLHDGNFALSNSPAFCGNGNIEFGEECETPGSNYCDTKCLWEGNDHYTGAGPTYNATDVCGNGIVEESEQCDNLSEPNSNNGDGCSNVCLLSGAVPGVDAVCGNGVVEDGEQCDQGELVDSTNAIISGDGCTGLTNPPGYDCINPANNSKAKCEDAAKAKYCYWTGTSCQVRSCLLENTPEIGNQNYDLPVCGNGIVELGEECDWGANVNNSSDGCSSRCINDGSIYDDGRIDPYQIVETLKFTSVLTQVKEEITAWHQLQPNIVGTGELTVEVGASVPFAVIGHQPPDDPTGSNLQCRNVAIWAVLSQQVDISTIPGSIQLCEGDCSFAPPAGFDPTVAYHHPLGASGGETVLWKNNIAYSSTGGGFSEKNLDNSGLPSGSSPTLGYYNPFTNVIHLWYGTDLYVSDTNGTNFTSVNPANFGLPSGINPTVAYYYPFNGGRLMLWAGSTAYYTTSNAAFTQITDAADLQGLPSGQAPTVGYYYPFSGGRVVVWFGANAYIWNGTGDFAATGAISGLPSGQAPTVGFYTSYFGGEVQLWFNSAMYDFDSQGEFGLSSITFANENNLINSFSYKNVHGECVDNGDPSMVCDWGSLADPANRFFGTCRTNADCIGTQLIVDQLGIENGYLKPSADYNLAIDPFNLLDRSGQTLDNSCSDNETTCNWDFSTSEDFCECDFVGVSIDPTSGGTLTTRDLFTCATNECGSATETPFDDDAANGDPASEEDLSGNQHVYNATCYDITNPQGQRIPLSGLGIKYDWSEIDPDELIFVTETGTCSPTSDNAGDICSANSTCTNGFCLFESGSTSYVTPGDSFTDIYGKHGQSEVKVTAQEFSCVGTGQLCNPDLPTPACATPYVCLGSAIACDPTSITACNNNQGNCVSACQAHTSAHRFVSVTNFICENPWPDAASFKDITSNCTGTGTCPVTNFELFYCQDAGVEGIEGDLNSLIDPDQIGTLAGRSGTNVLKDFLIPVCNDAQECDDPTDVLANSVIGVRVLSNPLHLSPSTWYRSGLCGGVPTFDNICFSDLECGASNIFNNNLSFEEFGASSRTCASAGDMGDGAWQLQCSSSGASNSLEYTGTAARTGDFGAKLTINQVLPTYATQLVSTPDYYLDPGSYQASVWVKSGQKVSFAAQYRGGTWNNLCTNANCDFGSNPAVCNNQTGEWERLICSFNLTEETNVQFYVRGNQVGEIEIDDLSLTSNSCQFNVPAQGNPSITKVDNYEALREGRSVYVGAANRFSDQLYSNIYLLSFDETGNNVASSIVNRILDPNQQQGFWKFNLDFTNHRVCQTGVYEGTNYVCGGALIGSSNESTCSLIQSEASCNAAAQSLGCYWDSGSNGCTGKSCEPIYCENNFQCPTLNCSANKEKVVRDNNRYGDLRDIQLALEDFASQNGSYPTLTGGTYIASTTFSIWPSWGQTLASELGKNIQSDPINRFTGCGDYFCDDDGNGVISGSENTACEPGVLSTCNNNPLVCLPQDPDENTTCWDEVSKLISCPADIFAYAYRSAGNGNAFELYTRFEYDQVGSWRNRDGSAGLPFYELPLEQIEGGGECRVLNFEVHNSTIGGGGAASYCAAKKCYGGTNDPELHDCSVNGISDCPDQSPGTLCSGDADSDGVCDAEFTDNCSPTVYCKSNPLNCYNPDQLDANGDGLGDICDTTCSGDVDGDGACDEIDVCRTVFDPYQEDSDGDNIGNACDPCTDIDDDGWWDLDTGANDPNICGADNCSPRKTGYCQESGTQKRNGQRCFSGSDCEAPYTQCFQPFGGTGVATDRQTYCEVQRCYGGSNNPAVDFCTSGSVSDCPDSTSPDASCGQVETLPIVCTKDYAQVCPAGEKCCPAQGQECGSQLTGDYATYNPFQEDYDNDLAGYICDDCIDFDGDSFGDYSFYLGLVNPGLTGIFDTKQKWNYHFAGCQYPRGTFDNFNFGLNPSGVSTVNYDLDNCPGGSTGAICHDEFGVQISCFNPASLSWTDVDGNKHNGKQEDYNLNWLGNICDPFASVCGDGVIDASIGEVCDCGVSPIDPNDPYEPGLPGSASCTSQNNVKCIAAYGTSATCNWCNSCVTIETEKGGFCGDNVAQYPNEQCDGKGCKTDCSGPLPGGACTTSDDYAVISTDIVPGTFSNTVTTGTFNMPVDCSAATSLIANVNAINAVPNVSIVIVNDKSGSMTENHTAGGYTAQRMQHLKRVLTGSAIGAMPALSGGGAIDKLFEEVPNMRIGAVEFSNESSIAITSPITQNKTSLENAINGITAAGGTYMRQGLREAFEMQYNYPSDHKIVILVSDGAPSGTTGNPQPYTGSTVGYVINIGGSNITLSLDQIKNDIDIYTLFIGDGNSVVNDGNNLTTSQYMSFWSSGGPSTSCSSNPYCYSGNQIYTAVDSLITELLNNIKFVIDTTISSGGLTESSVVSIPISNLGSSPTGNGNITLPLPDNFCSISPGNHNITINSILLDTTIQFSVEQIIYCPVCDADGDGVLGAFCGGPDCDDNPADDNNPTACPVNKSSCGPSTSACAICIFPDPNPPGGGAPLPTATEVCNDGIDNNCNGFIDAADPACVSLSEICGDGLDNDNNGKVDCFDPACAGQVGAGGIICCQNQNDCNANGNTCSECNTTIHACIDLSFAEDGPNCNGDCTFCSFGSCVNRPVGDSIECGVAGDSCQYVGQSLQCTSTTDSENCSNLIDDDGDGLIDCADTSCAGDPGPGGVICCQQTSNCDKGAGSECQACNTTTNTCGPTTSSNGLYCNDVCTRCYQGDCVNRNAGDGTECEAGFSCEDGGAGAMCIPDPAANLQKYYPDKDGDGFYSVVPSACAPGPGCPPTLYPVNPLPGPGSDCDDETTFDPAGCPANPSSCNEFTFNCAICVNPGRPIDYPGNGVDEDCDGFDSPSTATCGDGICQDTGGENCLTCEDDCGICSSLCFDSDGSISAYTIPGNVTTENLGIQNLYTDACSDGTTLIEQGCVDPTTRANPVTINCVTQFGAGWTCVGGACVSPGDSCVDGDGSPINFSQAGTVSGVSGGAPFTYSDYCSGSSLNEYGCSGDTWVLNESNSGSPIDCSTLGTNWTCIAGACQPPADVCNEVGDVGYDDEVLGTVSGFITGVAYSNTDTCSGNTLTEWRCVNSGGQGANPQGVTAQSTSIICSNNASTVPGSVWSCQAGQGRCIETAQYYLDQDGDGHISEFGQSCIVGQNCPAGMNTTPGDDCDDSNPLAFYQPTEDYCTDGFDNDCDGATDALDSDCDAISYWADDDGDTWYDTSASNCLPGANCPPAGSTTNSTDPKIADCNDSDPDVNPGPTAQASENSCDGVDNDCDGSFDELYQQNTVVSPSCGVGECATTGFLNCQQTEGGGVINTCTPKTAPESQEICNDGLDNECNGFIDDNPPCVNECVPGTKINCIDLPEGQAGDPGFLGLCGAVEITCNANGAWPKSQCQGPLVAENDSANTCTDNKDNDCDGLIDCQELTAGGCAPESVGGGTCAASPVCNQTSHQWVWSSLGDVACSSTTGPNACGLCQSTAANYFNCQPDLTSSGCSGGAAYCGICQNVGNATNPNFQCVGNDAACNSNTCMTCNDANLTCGVVTGAQDCDGTLECCTSGFICDAGGNCVSCSDMDKDGICDESDICPHDPNNDIDNDYICATGCVSGTPTSPASDRINGYICNANVAGLRIDPCVNVSGNQWFPPYKVPDSCQFNSCKVVFGANEYLNIYINGVFVGGNLTLPHPTQASDPIPSNNQPTKLLKYASPNPSVSEEWFFFQSSVFNNNSGGVNIIAVEALDIKRAGDTEYHIRGAFADVNDDTSCTGDGCALCPNMPSGITRKSTTSQTSPKFPTECFFINDNSNPLPDPSWKTNPSYVYPGKPWQPVAAGINNINNEIATKLWSAPAVSNGSDYNYPRPVWSVFSAYTINSHAYCRSVFINP